MEINDLRRGVRKYASGVKSREGRRLLVEAAGRAGMCVTREGRAESKEGRECRRGLQDGPGVENESGEEGVE